MKYILKILDHAIGKIIWLLLMWIVIFAMLLFWFFGMIWDFNNHVQEDELSLITNHYLEFKGYKFTSILNTMVFGLSEDY
mgnify:CR=1 FL=1